MTTLILLNPMGTDVTNFVNNTPLIPQLMHGSLLKPGDVVYTVPYSNTSGFANIEAGVGMLDTALHNIAGNKFVFAYSEGGQIADMWLANQGQKTPIPPSELTFLSIANANSNHRGFAYNQPVFDPVGYTLGQVSSAYEYTIFARQYDGVSDFPTDPAIIAAEGAIEGALYNIDQFTNAMRQVTYMVEGKSGPNQLAAATNAAIGMALIHNYYFDVTVADPQNVSYVDPSNGVTYVWSPTYPVPSLGTAWTIPSRDQQLRQQIETCYQRPVTMPTPNYAAYTGGWMSWLLNGEPIQGYTGPALF